jgi:hypothetical protein
MKRMVVKDNYSRTVWKKEEDKFKTLERKVRIPDEKLEEVDSVLLKREQDFEKIPDKGGCYWIWTNEPVCHRLHKNPIPRKMGVGEIIYNGIAKDDVRLRIKRHLLGQEHDQWSAISLDIYPHRSTSHRKKAMSSEGKVPYVASPDRKDELLEQIRNKDLLGRLFLSRREREYIAGSRKGTHFFRNGINILEAKHKKYRFIVYFITGLNWLYLEYIEKNWRAKYGLPKLCSYSSGR